MCIICNIDAPNGMSEADVFLGEYSQAQHHMKKAAAALLAVQPHVLDKAHRKQYDRIHKRMKAIMRDWNNIEHQREQHGATDQAKG